MRAYAIVIKGHPVSEAGYNRLKESSRTVGNDFEICRFDAITPDTVDAEMESRGLKWNWPDTGSVMDKTTGLRKIAYGGPPKNRYACAMSHYNLWKAACVLDTPFMILEHDAQFTRKFDPSIFTSQERYGVLGINDPHNATRLPDKFHSIVVANRDEKLIPVPTIDRMEIPQGLAGGSAYMVKPWAASDIIIAAEEFGLWPNDALICQQLFNYIGVTTTYYTTIQKLKSTTSFAI